jgi:hypothetical protein
MWIIQPGSSHTGTNLCYRAGPYLERLSRIAGGARYLRDGLPGRTARRSGALLHLNPNARIDRDRTREEMVDHFFI